MLAQTQNNIKENKIIETRVGKITQCSKNTFFFPVGLWGFQDFKNYILAPFPGMPIERKYYILQSLENDSLCFILYKVELSDNEEWCSFSHPQQGTCFEMDTTECFVTVVIEKNQSQEIVKYNKGSPILFCHKTYLACQFLVNYDK